MLYSIIILFWLALGVIGAGFSHAQEKRRWPEIYRGREELGSNLIFAIGGPLALLVCFAATGFGKYGWTLSTRKEK